MSQSFSDLSDEALCDLQRVLLRKPEAGDVIEGTGGLRKMRHADTWRPWFGFRISRGLALSHFDV